MDSYIPSQVQWKLDYLAPEYIIDGPGSWGTGVDVYSRMRQGFLTYISGTDRSVLQWGVCCTRCIWAANRHSKTTARSRLQQRTSSRILCREAGREADGGKRLEKKYEVSRLKSKIRKTLCGSMALILGEQTFYPKFSLGIHKVVYPFRLCNPTPTSLPWRCQP